MTTRHWPDQPTMVEALFKKMPGNAGTFMHAAIGMAGEAGEIFLAHTRKNFLLELGDFEFYLEAAWQAIDCPASERGASRHYLSPLDNDLQILQMQSLALLDAGKKAWVYEKSLDENLVAEILIELGECLDGIYEVLGFAREEVLNANIEKLSARYPNGFYTNKDAQMKVDQCSTCGADLEDTGCPHGH